MGRDGASSAFEVAYQSEVEWSEGVRDEQTVLLGVEAERQVHQLAAGAAGL